MYDILEVRKPRKNLSLSKLQSQQDSRSCPRWLAFHGLKEMGDVPFKWRSHLFNMINNKVTQDFGKIPFLPTPAHTATPSPPPRTAIWDLLVIACAAIPKPLFSNCVWLLALKWNLIYSQMPFYRTVKKEAHGFWRGRAAPTWPSTLFAVGCYSSRLCASPLVSSEKLSCEENSENGKVTCKAFCTICMARLLCAICVAWFPHSCFKIDLHVWVVNYKFFMPPHHYLWS